MTNKTTFETINIDDFIHDPINQEKVQSYPPELVGRFNSFIVTAFDDSMTVEMQIRTLIKWIKENIDVTMSALDNMEAFKQDSMAFMNHVKNTLVTLMNNFTDKFDDNLKAETLELLNQWLIEGILSDIVRVAINEEVINARGGKDSLNERLDESDNQLLNINNELINARDGKDSLNERLNETDTRLEQTNEYMNDIVPLNIRSFGARSIYEEGYENFDSTQAIKDAISYALTSEGQSYVFIPSGYYQISDEIVIPASIKIEGLYEKGNSGHNAMGSHIHQKTSGKSIFKFVNKSYGTEISKLRLSGGKAGIEVVYETENDIFSEFIIEKIHFNGGFESAIILKGTIGRISDCDFSANQIGITMAESTSVWIEHNNFWDAQKHHLLFKGSHVFTRINNNWFEKNGLESMLFQSPVGMYGVSFTDNQFYSSNEQYVLKIDGNTNPTSQLSLKNVVFTRCLLTTLGGINSVIRVQQRQNTASGNNQIVDFHDCIFSNVKVAGISTDYKWLYWNLVNVTQYETWNTGEPKSKVYSPEGITGVVYSEYNLGHTFQTNNAIRLLTHNGRGTEEGMIFRGTTGDLYYRDETEARKIIVASNKLVGRKSPSTFEEVHTNYMNLVNALIETGIIK